MVDSAPLTCQLLTPEGEYLSCAARMVQAPGIEGEFGVLQGHIPLITVLRPGVVQFSPASGTAALPRVFVEGGFIQVDTREGMTRCRILADSAVDVREIDAAAVRRELNDSSLTEERRQVLRAMLAAA